MNDNVKKACIIGLRIIAGLALAAGAVLAIGKVCKVGDSNEDGVGAGINEESNVIPPPPVVNKQEQFPQKVQEVSGDLMGKLSRAQEFCSRALALFQSLGAMVNNISQIFSPINHQPKPTFSSAYGAGYNSNVNMGGGIYNQGFGQPQQTYWQMRDQQRLEQFIQYRDTGYGSNPYRDDPNHEMFKAEWSDVYEPFGNTFWPYGKPFQYSDGKWKTQYHVNLSYIGDAPIHPMHFGSM